MKQKQEGRILGDNGKLTRAGVVLSLIFPVANVWMIIQDVNYYLRLVIILGCSGFFFYLGWLSYAQARRQELDRKRKEEQELREATRQLQQSGLDWP